jgi:uncharacterized protein YceK
MSQMAYAAGSSADSMFPARAVIYGGTRCHCGIVVMASTNGRLSSQPSAAPALLFVLLDMPLSFVADTLLLPITIVEWAMLGPADDDAANDKGTDEDSPMGLVGSGLGEGGKPGGMACWREVRQGR